MDFLQVLCALTYNDNHCIWLTNDNHYAICQDTQGLDPYKTHISNFQILYY